MCEEKEEHIHRLFGGDSEKDPPVPIPNTEVKLLSAESTCLDTDRKDRTPPNFYSSLAQSVEPAAVNRVVVGSSPTGGAKSSLNRIRFGLLFLLLEKPNQILSNKTKPN